jgi:hypothetical protein
MPQVVLWAPSACHLSSFRQRNRLFPTPSEVLWYVEHGYAQILAREWWIDDEKERQKAAKERYKYARWRDNFDGRIREIWRSEKELGRTASSKVRSASPETGTAWAEDQIRQGRVDCEKVMSQLDRTRLPKGYLEKIEGLEAPAAVKSLLRDTRNHGVAFRESGADRNLGSPVDSYFLKVFAKNATVPEHNLVVEAGPIPQADRIVQGFDFVLNKISRSAKAPKSHGEAFERTRLLLEDEKGLNELRYWASTFDHFALAEFDSLRPH